MELCAIPSIEALDIKSLIMQYVDPDMPDLSSRENKLYANQLSTLIKNKLNGVVYTEFGDEVAMVADLMCENINRFIKFRQVNKILVCIDTGECLIEGIVNEY